jgi:gliding motility-associated-like protein
MKALNKIKLGRGWLLILASMIWNVSPVISQNSDCSTIGFETMATNANQILVPGWQLWTGKNDVAGPYTIENPETHSSYNCGAGLSHAPTTHCAIGGTGVKVYHSDYEHHDIKGPTTANIADLIAAPPLPNFSGTNSRCIRLGGEQQAGWQASGMSTTFTVDAGNPFLAYHYLLRFENTGHTVDNRAFAYLRIKDDQGNIISCGSFETYEDNPNENWDYDTNWDTWYMPDWKSWIVDLNNFVGQTLDIEVWVADCQEGAHAGWGYFDFECLPNAIPDCSTAPCINPSQLNLASTSGSICVTDPFTISGTTFGGGATQVSISHDGNGSLSQASSTTSPFNVTYTPVAGDAGNTVTVTFTTDAEPGCSPVTETFEISIDPIITPTFPSFGPYCVGDPGNVLPNTSNEGITGSWNGAVSTATAGNSSFIFTPDPGQCADPTNLSIDVFNCTPLEVCLENNGDITVSGGDGPYDWDEEGTINTTTNINNEAECIACPGANPNYFFGIYTGCSQTTCASTTTGWIYFATGTTITPSGIYPIQVTDVNGQIVVITDPNAIPLCSGCTPPNLVADNQSVCSPATVDLNTAINGASDPGNATFYSSSADANAATNAIGAVVSATGTYYIRLENASDPSCFSVQAVNLTVDPIYNITDNINACENSIVTYPDGTTATIIANTSHTSNLSTTAGCDSIIVTNVTMDPIQSSSSNSTVCSGNDFTYADGTISMNITTNESHTSTLLSVQGCDSLVTENITVDLLDASVASNSPICENQTLTLNASPSGLGTGSYSWVGPNGPLAPSSANFSMTPFPNLIPAGYYSVTVNNGSCTDTDSVLVVSNPTYNLIDNLSVCSGSDYTYPDGTMSTNITANESHTSNLTSSLGCDSTIVTNITISTAFTSTENFTICEGTDYTYPDGSISTNIIANESHVSTFVSIMGCDSLVTTDLTVTSVYNTTENNTVCTGGSYTYPDGTVSTNITANESHISNLSTVAGCDSIITTNITINSAFTTTENFNICEGTNYTYPDGTVSTNITVNESHVSTFVSTLGCDSLVTTNLTVDPIYNITENINACENSTVTYPDGTTATITANTSHTSNLTTLAGCDSIIVTNVNMDPNYNISENINACENSTVTYPDGTTATIIANTSHTSNLTTIAGCDSIIVTNVTMDPNYNITENITACENSAVTYPDGTTVTITANTSHTSNLITIAGCDSIIVTNVTMDPVFASTVNVTVCTGATYTYPDGTVSTNITVNESQISTLTSVAGCDSMITTNVTVSSAFTSTQDFNICEGTDYTYPDGTVSTNITVNESHVSTFVSTMGCDSLVTTNLTVDPIYNITENINACENSSVTYPDGTTASIIANTTYISNLTSISGCDSIITTLVTMTQATSATQNITACENATITFPDGNNQVITSSTSYISTFSNTAGCDSIIITNVTMSPTTNSIDNVSICYGDNYTYPDGTVSSNLLANETHVSVLTNSAGCDSIITTNVQINQLPYINAGPDQSICEGESAELSASGASSYIWNNGVVDGVPFLPTVSNTYTVTGTDNNGCTNSDDVDITLFAAPNVDFMADITSGCAPQIINFSYLADVVGTNCIWDMGDGTTIIGCGDINYTYDYPGVYDVSLTVTTLEGCEATMTYPGYINIYENAHASFTASDYQVDLYDTEVDFTNNSINADTYIWNFGDGISSYEEHPSHTYPELGNTTYDVMLIANNTFDCPDTAYSSITVLDELIYYVPNVFTPDGDQFNEMFQPVFTSGYDPYDFHLMIFNRWGELIFESFNADIGWDGTYGDGGLVQDGVYVWKINFKESMTDKKHEVYGHVTVLK